MNQDADQRRLEALRHYAILDTPREDTFDLITGMLAQMLGVPHACVSLVDEKRVWFKSAVGVEAEEIKREDGFCSTLVAGDEEVRHIEDALADPGTQGNSLVCGAPNIRFYAGAPLCTPEGWRIGTLCAFGPVARPLTPTERDTLLNMTTLVMNEIELRRARRELERTEAALRTSQRLESIGMVASGVAHDFNNLLGGMLGLTELLRPHVEANPTGQELVTGIINTGHRAAELVSQVLAYAGHDEDSPVVALNVNALVRETHRMLETSLETCVRIHMELRAGLPAVLGQSTGVRQLILNLLKNASEACGKHGGNVWLKTALGDDGRSVVLIVADDGRGMSEETRTRVFEPFFSSKPGSRGLGLAICRRIVEQYGASIDVDSEIGRGTTFQVTLPACADSPVPEDHTADSSTRPTGQGIVLVVDDEDVICELARRCLEDAGYEVLVAPGGAKAIEALDKSAADIDVVVLDWNMPQVNGEEVLKAMRERRLSLPVILSSGHTQRAARERTAAYAIRHFLKKPYALGDLVIEVQAAQATARP